MALDEQVVLTVNTATEQVSIDVITGGTAAGTAILFGSGVPSSGLGAVGGAYLDIVKGWFYQKTGVATWTFKGALSVSPGTSTVWGTDGSGNPLSRALSFFQTALVNSAGLAAALSDETGFSTGAKAVFSINPVFTTGLSFTDLVVSLKNTVANGDGLYRTTDPIATFDATGNAYYYAGGLLAFIGGSFSVNGNLQVVSDLFLSKEIIPPGTTGAQVINALTGRVNFAALATSLVVTNSFVTADSIIQATVATNDSTMKSASVVAGSGSFTIYPNVAPTGETAVNFSVSN